MSGFIFYLLAIPWAGVFMSLLLWSTVLEQEMKNNRVPRDRPMWDVRRGAFSTDPADLTDIGKVYRQKAMVVELALCFWGAVGLIGYSILSAFSD